MTDNLRERVLLSLQRAMVGEITPEIQAVAVHVSPAAVEIRLFVDEGCRIEVAEDFDAGAITQVVADFCWPERGDPQIAFDAIEVPKGRMILLAQGYTAVFVRADVPRAGEPPEASPVMDTEQNLKYCRNSL